MRKGIGRGLMWLLILALAPLLARAEAEDGLTDVSTLFLNTRADYADEGAPVVYHFTPARAGRYLFISLPGEGTMGLIDASLSDEAGGEIAASSREGGFRLEAALDEGERVALSVSGGGEGSLCVEVMEDVYGRCVEQPTQLGEQGHYTRAIVEPRDTHWYAIVPPRSGWYTIRSVTGGEGAPDLRAYLMDRDRREIGFSDDVMFPDCADFRLFVRLNQGEPYFLRVSADSNQTGHYELLIGTAPQPRLLPVNVAFVPDRLTLAPGATFPLNAEAEPRDALHAVTYISQSPEVCAVSQDGLVTALDAGEAVIRGLCAEREFTMTVTVSAITPTALSLEETAITLAEEAQVSLRPVFTPDNATETDLTFASSDPEVASVDADGVITGLRAGSCAVTALSPAGLSASAEVTVTPRAPVCRALVVGEQNYEDGRVRLGGLNTAQGVKDMLAAQSAAGQRYQVTMLMDTTRDELLQTVGEVFSGAREGDLSLVYINCHGDYDGVAYIELHDGTRVTAEQLYMILSGIGGRVAVIVDCCRSGAFLGADAGPDRFTRAVTETFAGGEGRALRAGKFIVMTSAGADEDSYRRSFTSGTDEAGMATILARALCEGAGWDLIGDRVCTLKADANKDRAVTAQELWAYTRKRVMYYLSGTGVSQSVRFWPEGDQTVLGGKE